MQRAPENKRSQNLIGKMIVMRPVIEVVPKTRIKKLYIKVPYDTIFFTVYALCRHLLFNSNPVRKTPHPLFKLELASVELNPALLQEKPCAIHWLSST
jgi:hypothetical protein